MTTQNIFSEPPAIRRESDLIAYALGSLGYWPKNSLIFVISPQQRMGPVLRLDISYDDLADPDGAVQVLAATLENTPDLAGTEPQIFALFLADGEHPRLVDDAWESSITLETDRWDSRMTGEYVSAIRQFATDQGMSFADALYIGYSSIWGVLFPERESVYVGMNREILESPLGVYLISEGCTIEDSRSVHADRTVWSPLDDSADSSNWEKESRRWYRAYCGQLAGLEGQNAWHFRRQLQAQLALWDNRLAEIAAVMTKSRSHHLRRHNYFAIQDHLEAAQVRKALPPQIAGFLAATLTDRSFSHYLLHLALTELRRTITIIDSFESLSAAVETQENSSDRSLSLVLPLPGSSCPKLDKLCQKLAEPSYYISNTVMEATALQNLDKLAKIVAGNMDEAPDWLRLDVLEVLCFAVLPVARSEGRAHAYGLLAWINWLRGKSSLASYYLEKTASCETPTIFAVQTALECSSLPKVALSASTSWATHHQRLNNPGSQHFP